MSERVIILYETRLLTSVIYIHMNVYIYICTKIECIENSKLATLHLRKKYMISGRDLVCPTYVVSLLEWSFLLKYRIYDCLI